MVGYRVTARPHRYQESRTNVLHLNHVANTKVSKQRELDVHPRWMELHEAFCTLHGMSLMMANKTTSLSRQAVMDPCTTISFKAQ